MPTYVYECSACEGTFEVEQRIVEDPLRDCECGGKGTMKRIIQPTAIMFKGSGFYVTDSASGSDLKKATTTETTTPAIETPAATPAPVVESKGE